MPKFSEFSELLNTKPQEVADSFQIVDLDDRQKRAHLKSLLSHLNFATGGKFYGTTLGITNNQDKILVFDLVNYFADGGVSSEDETMITAAIIEKFPNRLAHLYILKSCKLALGDNAVVENFLQESELYISPESRKAYEEYFKSSSKKMAEVLTDYFVRCDDLTSDLRQYSEDSAKCLGRLESGEQLNILDSIKANSTVAKKFLGLSVNAAAPAAGTSGARVVRFADEVDRPKSAARR